MDSVVSVDSSDDACDDSDVRAALCATDKVTVPANKAVMEPLNNDSELDAPL